MMDSSTSVRDSCLLERMVQPNTVKSKMQHARMGRKEAQVLNLKVLEYCAILV